ncbi:hypothetical protein [Sulfurovum sp. NBC37-1]|uniref:hypothetical protein n=1 Tax=Sulfurovum sp. (strain NBC37-1) TaxID=387093 RepID=UPI0003182CEE|nr:hypothetical protein [Sulfurovum sp. NBC37-1]
MKKVTVVRAEEVEVKPIDLHLFTVQGVEKKLCKRVSKKELKEIAENLGLSYDDIQISFAKKLMNAYMEKEIK